MTLRFLIISIEIEPLYKLLLKLIFSKSEPPLFTDSKLIPPSIFTLFLRESNLFKSKFANSDDLLKFFF